MAEFVPAPTDALLASDCDRGGTVAANLADAMQLAQGMAHRGLTCRFVTDCDCGCVHVFGRDAVASRRRRKAGR